MLTFGIALTCDSKRAIWPLRPPTFSNQHSNKRPAGVHMVLMR
jgi:hypothetical protein